MRVGQRKSRYDTDPMLLGVVANVLEIQCPEGTWICMTGEYAHLLLKDTFTHFSAAYNYASSKKDPFRVTQVIPVAGNLPLADNHTREHHPGLNASVRLGHTHGDADHRTNFRNSFHSARI